MTSYETLSVTKDDGIAWVSLNRPAVRNAINKQMQAELHEVWHGFRYDDDVRCVVLTGEGDAFCTGIDRAEAVSDENNAAMAAGDFPDYPTPWMYDDPGRDVGPKACDLWKPVIAAVQGMACGGAFYMLGEVEFIIAADDAVFFDPHVTYGMTAAFEPMQMLSKMPFHEIMRLSLLGAHERMSAERAREIGLVTEVVPARRAARAGRLGRPGHRRLPAARRPGDDAGAVDRARGPRARRPSGSPTCSPASARTRPRSRRARTASRRASARSGACADRRRARDAPYPGGSSRLASLPLGRRGSSSTNTTEVGHLKWAIRARHSSMSSAASPSSPAPACAGAAARRPARPRPCRGRARR